MQNTNEPEGTPPSAGPVGGQPAQAQPTAVEAGSSPLPGDTSQTPPAPSAEQVAGGSDPASWNVSSPPVADPYGPTPYPTAAYGPSAQDATGAWLGATPTAGPGYGAPGYPPGAAAPGYGGGGYGPGGYGPGGYGPGGSSTSGYPSGYATSGYPTGSAPTATAVPTYTSPASYPPPRRLTRSQDDRVLGGVLGGLARYWNTDPLLLRILTIVLTIATGGALLLGYLIAWIVIPLEPSAPSGGSAGTGYAAGGNPAYGPPGAPGALYEATPRPPRSYLGWLVVSIGLILAGVLAIIGIFTQSASFGAIVCSVILIVLGAGLIAGAWYGRARWLTILAVPMVFITMGAVAANAWVESPQADRWIASSDRGISVGSRTWTVGPEDVLNQPLEYRVTAGDALLDLTELTALNGQESGRPGQRVTVNVGVGLGQLIVKIPRDMQLNLAATVKAGQIVAPGVGTPAPSGTDLNVDTTIQPLTEGQPAYVVDLDAAIGAGNLEVRRDAA